LGGKKEEKMKTILAVLAVILILAAYSWGMYIVIETFGRFFY
jgi:preprotein translocase subunit SecE